MNDARTFPKELDSARKILENLNADFKGYYEIHDEIYKSKDSNQPLSQVFLRLRHVPINIWGEKEFIVAMKNTLLQEVGKQSVISVKEQFDTRAEAESFITSKFGEDFVKDFGFFRIGWQYSLSNGDGIDLEEIEGQNEDGSKSIYPSIEFKSTTQEGLKALLEKFGVQEDDVAKGPSVVVVREKLGII